MKMHYLFRRNTHLTDINAYSTFFIYISSTPLNCTIMLCAIHLHKWWQASDSLPISKYNTRADPGFEVRGEANGFENLKIGGGGGGGVSYSFIKYI